MSSISKVYFNLTRRAVPMLWTRLYNGCPSQPKTEVGRVIKTILWTRTTPEAFKRVSKMKETSDWGRIVFRATKQELKELDAFSKEMSAEEIGQKIISLGLNDDQTAVVLHLLRDVVNNLYEHFSPEYCSAFEKGIKLLRWLGEEFGKRKGIDPTEYYNKLFLRICGVDPKVDTIVI